MTGGLIVSNRGTPLYKKIRGASSSLKLVNSRMLHSSTSSSSLYSIELNDDDGGTASVMKIMQQLL